MPHWRNLGIPRGEGQALRVAPPDGWGKANHFGVDPPGVFLGKEGGGRAWQVTGAAAWKEVIPFGIRPFRGR
jgi:hypothetical protein